MTAFTMKKSFQGNYAKVRELFKKGEELEITITAVKDFGAFGIVVKNGSEYTALIHRTIIKPDDQFAEVSRYFKTGDIVKGIIRGFDEKGNMSLSTMDYFHLLPDYQQVKMEEIEKKVEIQEAVKQEVQVFTDKEVEEWYAQIKPTLEATLAFISPESEKHFKKIMKEIGIVKFCLSLGKIAPKFNVDPGLVLAEAIKEDTKGCL